MPRPGLRSRSVKKVRLNTPGGRPVTHYKLKRRGKAICFQCMKPLSGVPIRNTAKMMGLPKTKKRPERPYGGVLCSSCMRLSVKESRLYR